MAVDRVANSVATSGLAPQISGAIRQAAQSTGISFQYLLTTAQIESNLNPSAQASTSSAKGLYQFIEQTWLGTVKQDGAAFGLGDYADAISKGADGRYEVPDPATRAAVMKLRTDPAASAMMAGALARNNADQLTTAIGRAPTEGELYTAHFLGPEGAGRLINAAAGNKTASAAAMFPAAAAANKPIFFHRNGSPRTVAEVYDRLTAHFDNTRLALTQPSGEVAATQTAAAVSPLAIAVPDTAGVAQALAAADTRPPPQSTQPLFQAMFTDPARGALTRTVASLWSDTTGVATAAAPANVAAGVSPDQPVRTLELFTDGAADVRGIFHGRG